MKCASASEWLHLSPSQASEIDAESSSHSSTVHLVVSDPLRGCRGFWLLLSAQMSLRRAEMAITSSSLLVCGMLSQATELSWITTNWLWRKHPFQPINILIVNNPTLNDCRRWKLQGNFVWSFYPCDERDALFGEMRATREGLPANIKLVRRRRLSVVPSCAELLLKKSEQIQEIFMHNLF